MNKVSIKLIVLVTMLFFIASSAVFAVGADRVTYVETVGELDRTQKNNIWLAGHISALVTASGEYKEQNEPLVKKANYRLNYGKVRGSFRNIKYVTATAADNSMRIIAFENNDWSNEWKRLETLLGAICNIFAPKLFLNTRVHIGAGVAFDLDTVTTRQELIDYAKGANQVVITGFGTGGTLAVVYSAYLVEEAGISAANVKIIPLGDYSFYKEDFCKRYFRKLDILRVYLRRDKAVQLPNMLDLYGKNPYLHLGKVWLDQSPDRTFDDVDPFSTHNFVEYLAFIDRTCALTSATNAGATKSLGRRNIGG